MPDVAELLRFRRLIHALSGEGALDNVESVLRERAESDATVTSLAERLQASRPHEDHAA